MGLVLGVGTEEFGPLTSDFTNIIAAAFHAVRIGMFPYADTTFPLTTSHQDLELDGKLQETSAAYIYKYPFSVKSKSSDMDLKCTFKGRLARFTVCSHKIQNMGYFIF